MCVRKVSCVSHPQDCHLGNILVGDDGGILQTL